MSYCLYLRKSRADLELEAMGEMETLSRHKKTLLELAARQKLSVTAIYEEIVSGETIESRPVARRMLDEVEQGKWEGVLVMEVERLARGDTIDQGVIARAFKIGGAKIVTPAKTYDPENEFDEEYFEFGLFMSRREYKAINRRIQRGRIASAKEGKFLGSVPPYGYNKVRLSGEKGYTLAPHPEEAPVVELIYARYLQGNGTTAIAGYLDEMGVKPRKGDTWSKSTISDILSNPVYAGKLRWSYRKEQKYIHDGIVEKSRVINNAPLYADGLHPALISPKCFARTQERRKQNACKTTKHTLALQNPLSGLVYCKQCGRLMNRLGPNKRNRYAALRCSNPRCGNVSAPLFLVEKKLLDALQNGIGGYLLTAGNTKSGTAVDENIFLEQKAIKKTRRELSKIELQISGTVDLLEQGVYSVERFTARSKELNEKKEALSQKISALEASLASLDQAITMKSGTLFPAASILDAYSLARSAEEKNRILRSVLSKAEYIKEAPNTRGNLLNDNFELTLFPKLPFL